MKQHVFLCIVHKQPELLVRIVKRLVSPNHYFLIHVDKKTKNYNDFVNALEGIANVFFTKNRLKTYHGGISLVYCEILMLKEALNLPLKFDYYHLISGQDYPLRSNEQFDAFFENNENSYMMFDSMANVKKWLNTKYATRVNQQWPNTNTLLARAYKKICMRFVSKLVKRNKIHNLCGGWQWFSWNQQTLDFVLNYFKLHPTYLRRFNHTYCCDELVFPTILHNKCKKLHIRESMPLRYVSWTPKKRKLEVGKSRPYILNEEDFEDVVTSQAFFCRKVDLPFSAKLLDMIDDCRLTRLFWNDFVPIHR